MCNYQLQHEHPCACTRTVRICTQAQTRATSSASVSLPAIPLAADAQQCLLWVFISFFTLSRGLHCSLQWAERSYNLISDKLCAIYTYTCIYFTWHLRHLKGNAGEHRDHTYKQYYYVTHATVTHIPKVKESAGNRKITVSSLVNRANSHLTSSKAFGYCILQIAYSSAVMWSRIEKQIGFGWLHTKC